MPHGQFPARLEPVGPGSYAYVVGIGSWHQSNSGLVTSNGASLVVDTLITPGMTRRMLAEMARAEAAAGHVDVLVNTHGDGDHFWGNQLLASSRIVATTRAARDMRGAATPPQIEALIAAEATDDGRGDFLRNFFAGLDFTDLVPTFPTETFDGSLTVTVGDKTVELIEVGPAHTQGDLMVFVPGDRVLFAGDILFSSGHPAVWSGPFQNWIDVCARITRMEVDAIVPGHGPVTTREKVAEFRSYLEDVREQSTVLHERGLGVDEAARVIDLTRYADWIDGERILINIDAVYRELDGRGDPDRLDIFHRLSAFVAEMRSRAS
ncbi:MBL fold metallo-hydrolase [Amycolatopsis pigmentata]|uniref:MBL fold metallo-hydrolase n=1 Tax=Amycolatopsis pigmentata TaxID=450801 RepID=A0ABW5FPG7_9PSEU